MQDISRTEERKPLWVYIYQHDTYRAQAVHNISSSQERKKVEKMSIQYGQQPKRSSRDTFEGLDCTITFFMLIARTEEQLEHKKSKVHKVKEALF